LSVSDRILERHGERIQLTPKAVDTLLFLVQHAPQVVTKDALMNAVWPDVNVVESGLTRNISVLRKALEEGEAEGSYIETIPRRGYRFVAEVNVETEQEHEQRPAAVPEVIAPPPPARRWWLGALTVLCMLAAGLAFLVRPGRRTDSPVNPTVRIGEHLLYKLAPAETIRAAEHFERAIATAPSDAGAHAGLCLSLLQLSMLGIQRMPEVLPRADQSARKAIELDPNLASAHTAMAMVYLLKDWDFEKSERSFRRALALDPESVQVRLAYARLKLTLNQVNGARSLVEDALRLDPASPALGAEYCRVFYYLRDYHRAEAECRKVLDRESGYALAHYYLALSLGGLDRFQEAAASLDRSGLMPGVVDADRAWLDLRQGNPRRALAVLDERRALIRDGTIDASAKLLLACSLTYMDEAFEALEAALAARAPELLTLHIEPRLDCVRGDRRYAGVLQRIGIPASAHPQ
jgi:DNA-binding winged helix-turn-helix (wHTH) protein/Tfp pilus assembly protein PilF